MPANFWTRELATLAEVLSRTASWSIGGNAVCFYTAILACSEHVSKSSSGRTASALSGSRRACSPALKMLPTSPNGISCRRGVLIKIPLQKQPKLCKLLHGEISTCIHGFRTTCSTCSLRGMCGQQGSTWASGASSWLEGFFAGAFPDHLQVRRLVDFLEAARKRCSQDCPLQLTRRDLAVRRGVWVVGNVVLRIPLKCASQEGLLLTSILSFQTMGTREVECWHTVYIKYIHRCRVSGRFLRIGVVL